MTETPTNLQGPCSECGGYFLDLAAHVVSCHQPVAPPAPPQATTQAMPSWMFQQPAYEPPPPVYQEPQESTWSKIWNYSPSNSRVPGVCPQCSRFVEDLRSHQRWHDENPPNAFKRFDRWLSGK